MAAGTLLIANPAARHGETAKLLPVVEQLLCNLPHETVVTERAGQATELATAAVGYDRVVAVGGDGTVHEVLNGLMHMLGVPDDLARAALVLATGERRRFDVGLCNGVHFNNSFAAGLDAKVTAKAVEYKTTKRRSGLWLYVTALLHVLFRELSSFDVRVGFDEAGSERIDTLIVAVTIGKTYGGGFSITPDALPDDGLFDVCMIDPLSLPQALIRLPFVIIGRHTRMKPVHMSRHSSLVIDCDRALPAQIDGEVLLERHYDLSILPSAIEYIVPGGH
jgi:diacylglycerol kinase family enzyme